MDLCSRSVSFLLATGFDFESLGEDGFGVVEVSSSSSSDSDDSLSKREPKSIFAPAAVIIWKMDWFMFLPLAKSSSELMAEALSGFPSWEVEACIGPKRACLSLEVK